MTFGTSISISSTHQCLSTKINAFACFSGMVVAFTGLENGRTVAKYLGPLHASQIDGRPTFHPCHFDFTSADHLTARNETIGEIQSIAIRITFIQTPTKRRHSSVAVSVT